MLNQFNILYESIISEMNTNSFYPAKSISGNQLVGKDFRGLEQIWMIGPTMENNVTCILTGQKLPQYSTILWLPNANGYKKGIAVSYDAYTKLPDPTQNETLINLGLTELVDWENG